MINKTSISNLFKTEKIWVFSDQVLFSFISFCTTILLAKNLGVNTFGKFSSIVIISFLILSLNNAIIVSPLQVLMPKFENKNKYFISVFYMQILSLLIFAFISLIFYFSFPEFFEKLNVDIVFILIYIVGFVLQDFFRRSFLTTNKAKQAFMINIISNSLQIFCLIFAIFNKSINLKSAIQIVGFTYIPSILYALKFINFEKLCVSDFKLSINENFRVGKWLILSSFLQWWSNNFLIVASGLYLGITALGAIRLAQTIYGTLNGILQIIENYAIPIAAKNNLDSRIKLKNYLLKITKQSFILILPFILINFFFAKQIFSICGNEEFVEYSFALQGVSILYIFIFASNPIRIAIRVLLLNKHFFIAYVLSFLFSISTTNFILKNWHLQGVIFALIMNQFLMLIYWQIILRNKKFILWK